MKFKRYSLCLDEATYNTIKTISETTNNSIAEVTRELIQNGLARDWVNKNEDIITEIVRKQVDVVMKPNVKRLAALSSKCGHMAATAAFLNVQALMDLVPKENRRNVREMYNNARKKAFEYMRTKADDWDEIPEINDKF